VPPNNFPLGQLHTPPYARQAFCCVVVTYFQSYFVPIADISNAGMSVAAGCSGPDSNSVTVQFAFSVSLLAMIGPATDARHRFTNGPGRAYNSRAEISPSCTGRPVTIGTGTVDVAARWFVPNVTNTNGTGRTST